MTSSDKLAFTVAKKCEALTGGSDEKWLACDTFRNLKWPLKLILDFTPGESIIYVAHINIVVIASHFSALLL